VDLRHKTQTYLGETVGKDVLADLHTRMILPGPRLDAGVVQQATGMCWRRP